MRFQFLAPRALTPARSAASSSSVHFPPAMALSSAGEGGGLFFFAPPLFFPPGRPLTGVPISEDAWLIRRRREEGRVRRHATKNEGWVRVGTRCRGERKAVEVWNEETPDCARPPSNLPLSFVANTNTGTWTQQSTHTEGL